jgi:hypothetical protein
MLKVSPTFSLSSRLSYNLELRRLHGRRFVGRSDGNHLIYAGSNQLTNMSSGDMITKMD